jgi:hypothetical protein
MNDYVTCRLFGQLGNQLYQIATTLSYAWDHGAQAVFPGLVSPEYRISYNRERIFHRLDAQLPGQPFINLYNEKKIYHFDAIPSRPNLILSGYFQAWKYFHHHREKLLQTFAPSPVILQKLQDKYGEWLKRPNTVAVHVRTQNRSVHERGLHPFLGCSYFEKAMDLFPNDSEFFIFSDRTNWCKKHFQRNKKMTFVEGNDHVEDLYLMSLMNHTIMSNSSFSWWGAYLNQHRDQIIAAPSSFVDPKNSYYFDNPEFYPPNWNVCFISDIPFNAPYPPDMEQYDQYKSLD